jgi:hypothetical protein
VRKSLIYPAGTPDLVYGNPYSGCQRKTLRNVIRLNAAMSLANQESMTVSPCDISVQWEDCYPQDKHDYEEND